VPSIPSRWSSIFRSGRTVHKVLLGNEVLIIENLANLGAVAGRGIRVAALPINAKGGDGAMARVVAMETPMGAHHDEVDLLLPGTIGDGLAGLSRPDERTNAKALCRQACRESAEPILRRAARRVLRLGQVGVGDVVVHERHDVDEKDLSPVHGRERHGGAHRRVRRGEKSVATRMRVNTSGSVGDHARRRGAWWAGLHVASLSWDEMFLGDDAACRSAAS
jgi:hypothetical protein